MGEPARISTQLETPPVHDPHAIARAYRYHRAKRAARIERRREQRFARLRFWLVFVVGIAVICVAVLRRFGLEFPPSVPAPLIVVALGALATVFVLIRLISVPASVVGTSGRSVGIWISLLAAIAVIAAGLLQAN